MKNWTQVFDYISLEGKFFKLNLSFCWISLSYLRSSWITIFWATKLYDTLMHAVYLSAKKVFDNKMGSRNSRRGSTVVPIATKTHKNLPKLVGQLRWLQELLQRIQGPYEEFNNTDTPFANYQYSHDLKQDGRLSPGYFAPSNLVKMQF